MSDYVITLRPCSDASVLKKNARHRSLKRTSLLELLTDMTNVRSRVFSRVAGVRWKFGFQNRDRLHKNASRTNANCSRPKVEDTRVRRPTPYGDDDDDVDSRVEVDSRRRSARGLRSWDTLLS